MALSAYHVPGTVLGAKVTEVLVEPAFIQWGRQKSKYEDLMHCGRIIP